MRHVFLHFGVLPQHHLDELVEVDGAVAVLVNVPANGRTSVYSPMESNITKRFPAFYRGREIAGESETFLTKNQNLDNDFQNLYKPQPRTKSACDP